MEKKSDKSEQRAFYERQRVLRATRSCKKRGEISELAFLHKAASVGYTVSRPYGDSDRYDFIVHSGKRLWKVQVKSTGLLVRGAYVISAQKNENGKMAEYTADDIDFLVAHIVPDDAWMVIPIQALAPNKSFHVYPREDPRTNRYEQYRDAWWLME
ncbi:MAG: group I intron-associated PD-(D/E)XK endonuclease [Terriglobales bacterium]